jgi:hypothetical protein
MILCEWRVTWRGGKGALEALACTDRKYDDVNESGDSDARLPRHHRPISSGGIAPDHTAPRLARMSPAGAGRLKKENRCTKPASGADSAPEGGVRWKCRCGPNGICPHHEGAGPSLSLGGGRFLIYNPSLS